MPKPTSPPQSFQFDRFFMKKDWIRAKLAASGWCIESSTRFPALRLRCVDTAEIPLPSFSWFGSFDARGIDLLCSRSAKIQVHANGVRQVFDDLQPGKVLIQRDTVLFRYRSQEGNEFLLQIQPNPRGFSLTAFSSDFPEETQLVLTWDISGLFDPETVSCNHVRYFSEALAAGLEIRLQGESTARFERCGTNWLLHLSGDARLGLKTDCRVLHDTSLALEPPRFAVPGEAAEFALVTAETTPKWEVVEMKRLGWTDIPGMSRERVAGLFIGDPRWRHPLCVDPCGDIDHVEKTFLDLVIDSKAFDAIGLSRDGITEFGRVDQWMNLVPRVREAGLRVYMKPGDQELEALDSLQERNSWIRQNFDVAAEYQPDVLRLCWEAVLLPWTTADFMRAFTLSFCGSRGTSWTALA